MDSIWRSGWIAPGAIGFLFFRNMLRKAPPARTLDASTVHEIQSLNELVFVKYTVQKVVGLEEKKVPLGSEKLLLFVQAEVLAGIDLSSLTGRDVNPLPDKRLQIALPPPPPDHMVDAVGALQPRPGATGSPGSQGGNGTERQRNGDS